MKFGLVSPKQTPKEYSSELFVTKTTGNGRNINVLSNVLCYQILEGKKKKANTTLISPGTTNKYRFLEEWTKLTRKETILIECLDMTPKAQAAKAKISKWDYITPQSFYTAKETIIKTKRQPTEWQKVFASPHIL